MNLRRFVCFFVSEQKHLIPFIAKSVFIIFSLFYNINNGKIHHYTALMTLKLCFFFFVRRDHSLRRFYLNARICNYIYASLTLCVSILYTYAVVKKFLFFWFDNNYILLNTINTLFCVIIVRIILHII